MAFWLALDSKSPLHRFILSILIASISLAAGYEYSIIDDTGNLHWTENMRKLLFGIILALSIQHASASEAAAPTFKEGDVWSFKVTTATEAEKWNQRRMEMSIVRPGSKTMLVSMKEPESTLAAKEQLFGADWSVFRTSSGEENTVARPMKFPMSVGDAWNIEYTEKNLNPKTLSAYRKISYKVLGWEDVEVPAGTFKALKIEAEGTWRNDLAPVVGANTSSSSSGVGSTVVVQTQNAVARTTAGRLYAAYWYVPEVKTYVKSVYEDYKTSGERFLRKVEELESMKLK